MPSQTSLLLFVLVTLSMNSCILTLSSVLPVYPLRYRCKHLGSSLILVWLGTMTSADFSVLEISQGKTHVFHTYAPRIYILPFRVSIGLQRCLPPYPDNMPLMRFLFVRPVLCLRLPSVRTSQYTPCRSASSSPYRANTGLAHARRAPCLAHKQKTGRPPKAPTG